MSKKRKLCGPFDVYFGGMYSEPEGVDVREDISDEYRRQLIEKFGKEKVLCRNVWDVGEGVPGHVKSEFDCAQLVWLDDGGIEHVTMHWEYPVVCRMIISSGFEIENKEGRSQKTSGNVDCVVVYNGTWFMGIVDAKQFETIDEMFMAGPNIRDVFLELSKIKGVVDTRIVPPCIIPFSITVDILKGGKSRSKPRFVAMEEKTTGGVMVHYETEDGEVSEDELKEIVVDLFHGMDRGISNYYVLADMGHEEEAKRKKAMDLYDEIRGGVGEYFGTNSWNLFQKNRRARKLGEKVVELLVILVDNRLSQIRLMRQVEEIESLTDSKGILPYMRDYLKECIVMPLSRGAVEYEGLKETLQYIERISSQHNMIMLGVVAIVAGFAGALLGAVIS